MVPAIENNSDTPEPLCGVVVVDKPLGWTSMDVIRHIRHSTRQRKLKAGHAGTLDPLATGVLVCCIGKATKQIDQIMAGSKTYEAVVDLSAFTTTDDRQGEREEIVVDNPLDEQAIAEALTGFVGQIQQTPPVYSAIHVQGKRAYDLARAGKEVKLAPRAVTVHGITVLGYDWPCVSLRIETGKGVYIRSIARDLGKVLGTGGHLASLRRTRVGPFDLAIALPGQTLTQRELVQVDLMELGQAVALLEQMDGQGQG